MRSLNYDHIVITGSILMLAISLTSTPLIASFAVTTMLLAYITHTCAATIPTLAFGCSAIASGALTIIAYYANLLS